MPQDRSKLPPYFGIHPDQAMEALGPSTDADGFSHIAERCRKACLDLTARGLDEAGQQHLRPFSAWEITKYLIPVTPAQLREALRQNPDLPQGRPETEGGARWFTLEEVIRLRTFFGGEGSDINEAKPYRPPNQPAKITALANFKGGVGKTSTCAHLAMSAALDGYRVLVIDLDSQGSMTSIFGGRVEDEWQTAFPLLARHYARHLIEKRQRANPQEKPVELEDDTLTEALGITTTDLIQPTHWPNIDLLGSQLNLYWSEFQIPVWRMAARGWKLWDALSDSLEADGVLQDYDLIFLDTPPALGYLTINGLTAADILLVPLGASFVELDSTARFFEMLYDTFLSIENGENLVARTLGHDEIRFEWDAVRAILTRYDPSQQTEMAALMQAYMGSTLSTHRQGYTALIGQAGESVNGIYEADYRDFNRDTYARGRATFDATYADFKTLLMGSWRRDEIATAKSL